MLSILDQPSELCEQLGKRAQDRRLELEWTQAELASRSGVALSTLKRFEHTGQVSLERLMAIATVLRALDGFDALFAPPKARTLAELEARETKRKRGRRSSL